MNINKTKLKQVSEEIIKKRGRPAGVKNKPKQDQVLTFEKQLEEWDKKENTVNFKTLCERLQEALAKSYVEAENLNKEIRARDIIITYLEMRNK
jgi:hypothetical protein